MEVIVGRFLSHQIIILIVGSFLRPNAYLISWTKLEGTRPVSFALLVPFKKPSKFKLEITFIISFFCIMLLFSITIRFYFNFRQIHLMFYQNLIKTFIGLGYDFVRNLYSEKIILLCFHHLKCITYENCPVRPWFDGWIFRLFDLKK